MFCLPSLSKPCTQKALFSSQKKGLTLCVFDARNQCFSWLLIYGEEGGQHRVCLFFHAFFSTMRERLKRGREERERDREKKKELPPLSLFSLSLSAPPFSSNHRFILPILPTMQNHYFLGLQICFRISVETISPSMIVQGLSIRASLLASHFIFTAHTSISNNQV